MCDPARGSRYREYHGEHVGREAHGFQDDAGVEVDIRVELAADEVVVLERDLLELYGDLEQWIIDVELVPKSLEPSDDVVQRADSLRNQSRAGVVTAPR